MLCVHEAIKGLAELVTIVKPDEILSPSDVSVTNCFLIPPLVVVQMSNTIAIRMMQQRSRVYHC